MTTLEIGVDLGQGACRVVAQTGAGVARRIDTRGFWAGGDPAATVAGAVLSALGDDRGTAVSIGVGMTGLNGAAPEATAMAGAMAEALTGHGVSGALAVCDDSVTAYLGALGQTSGAVVVAGTGAVALGVDLATGRSARSDGWGAALGDRGSGYWIGASAVRAALRELDGGHRGALLDLVTRRWGDVSRIARRWREQPPSPEQVAAMASEVAALARAGDPTAGDVMARAGRLLGESVVDVVAATGRPDRGVLVAGSGGIFDAADLVGGPFAEAVRAGCPLAEIVPAAGGPLDGSLLLASAPALHPVLEAMITRLPLLGKSTHE